MHSLWLCILYHCVFLQHWWVKQPCTLWMWDSTPISCDALHTQHSIFCLTVNSVSLCILYYCAFCIIVHSVLLHILQYWWIRQPCTVWMWYRIPSSCDLHCTWCILYYWKICITVYFMTPVGYTTLKHYGCKTVLVMQCTNSKVHSVPLRTLYNCGLCIAVYYVLLDLLFYCIICTAVYSVLVYGFCYFKFCIPYTYSVSLCILCTAYFTLLYILYYCIFCITANFVL